MAQAGTWLLIGLASVALSAAQPALAASPQDDHIARIERDLRPVLQVRGRAVTSHTLAEEMARHHTPSVSIAVVDHGRIVWAKAYGLADVAGKAPATTRTLYQAGSISKPVAASAAMQLVQEGRLGLDKPVNAELKGWRLPDSAFTKDAPVTLRHLLTHTGGLTVHGFPGYAAGAAVPSVIQVLDGKPPANTQAVVSEGKPGVVWNYSGGGITIAQLLMSETDGRPFPELMRRRVLAPAGMADSTYEQPLPAARRAQAASGYLVDGAPVAGRFHTYPEMAAAGLWTTPSDLARWAVALEQAYNGEKSPLVSQASAQAMLTPGLGGWGLGIQVVGDGDRVLFLHGGDDWGFKARLLGWVKDERALVVMANGDDAFAVIEPLVQAVVREYGWNGPRAMVVDAVPLTEAQRSEVVGGWNHGALVVTFEDGRLVGRFRGQVYELIPQSPDVYFVAAEGQQPMMMKAVRGADGKIKSMVADGTPVRFDRDP
jgi:CubicO group peptidase (beta-lactamase class C family)